MPPPTKPIKKCLVKQTLESSPIPKPTTETHNQIAKLGKPSLGCVMKYEKILLKKPDPFLVAFCVTDQIYVCFLNNLKCFSHPKMERKKLAPPYESLKI